MSSQLSGHSASPESVHNKGLYLQYYSHTLLTIFILIIPIIWTLKDHQCKGMTLALAYRMLCNSSAHLYYLLELVKPYHTPASNSLASNLLAGGTWEWGRVQMNNVSVYILIDKKRARYCIMQMNTMSEFKSD
jgi:hypothetical protein